MSWWGILVANWCLSSALAGPVTLITLRDVVSTTSVTLVNKYTKIDYKDYMRYVPQGDGQYWKQQDNLEGIFISTSTASLEVIYKNQLPEETTVHAHGLISSANLDGVPYISSLPIQPKRSVRYKYDIDTSKPGTHYVHAQYGFHNSRGIKFPLIITGPMPTGYPSAADVASARDAVLFLEDFCPYAVVGGGSVKDVGDCSHPDTAFNHLQTQWASLSSAFNWTNCEDPISAFDVEYSYYLANNKAISEPVLVYVSAGQKVRLRTINAASGTNFKLDLGVMQASSVVIMVDGQVVQPLSNGDLWIAVGQRIDIILTAPTDNGSFPIFAIAEGLSARGQSGIVLIVGGNQYDPQPGQFSFTPAKGPGLMGTSLESALRAYTGLAEHPVTNKYSLHITGRYGFQGFNQAGYQLPPVTKAYAANAQSLLLASGDRICLIFHNFNGKSNAIHIHGHVFQVTSIDGNSFSGAMRDTVLIPGGRCSEVTVCFDATNPGIWALMSQMEFDAAAGMATTIEYTA